MATNLAVIAFCIFLIRGIIFIVQKLRSGETVTNVDRKTWMMYLFGFVSGVLFANAVPHFVHGISGEDFPAPLGQYLGPGFPHSLANVIWGWVNIVCGYNLFVLGKVSGSTTKWGMTFFFGGILVMSIFLAFVFSH